MNEPTADDALENSVRRALQDAAARLRQAGARDEALARYVAPHRVLLVQRPARMEPLGRVWRLGVLLLSAEGDASATGSVTRSAPPSRPAYQSLSAEARRQEREAAFRGRYPAGETVNFAAEPVAVDATALRSGDGVLFARGDEVFVRWKGDASGDGVELRAYLDDHVSLLEHPPLGA
ncbi:hypothetical protein WDJ51_10165 [Rathayibacter sp. YIM 133350]|uniref:hypothetical protein n=1 Tax=Rathayibacter sp. YIM 133350 TaxID=3131992 RepID=UPI00307F1EDD